VGIFERAQEVLARTVDYYFSAVGCINCLYSGIRDRAVYLHLVLIGLPQSKIQICVQRSRTNKVKRAPIVKTLRSYSIIALITLGLIEGVLQISQTRSLRKVEIFKKLYQLSNREQYLGRYCDSYAWKYEFVRSYETHRQSLLDAEGLHLPHPTRGWTTKPNLSVNLNGKQYTTNHRGHRSLQNDANDPQKYSILILGDSYTFGIDADDRDVWTNILQARDKQINVINLAVGGYGLDQMYITLQESIALYKPNLVIAALIEDDIRRMKFDFRDYQKPLLKIENDELVVTNTPIKGVAETYQETKQEIESTGIPVLKIDDLFSNVTIICQANYRLFSKVLDQMQFISQNNGAEFLAVYLASGVEVEDKTHKGYGEQFLEKWLETHRVEGLNTRPYFLQKSGVRGGHYQKVEATLVGRVVYDKIKTLSSWKDFVGSKKK
jgi:hypothetical protein